MTLFLWFAFVSALVGYVAVSPMEPAQEAERTAQEASLETGIDARVIAGVEAGAPALAPGRAMWLGFLAGLGADLLWTFLLLGWTLATGSRPQGIPGVLLLAVTGLVAFAAIWWLMLKHIYRVRGPQLRRLVLMLLISYPVVLGLGLFLDR